MTDLVQHHVQGHIVGQRRDDGYINATELCKRAGKEWGHFWENDGAKVFAEELSQNIGIPISRLIQRVSIGFPAITTTWVHPELAVHVAYWAGGPKWQARIGSIVVDYMRGLVRHQTYSPLLLPSPADWQRRFQGEVFEELGACAVGVFCWVIGARPSERWDLGPSVDLWPARLWDGNSTREGRNARDSCFLRGRWALRAPEPVRWPASTGLSTWPASPSA